MEIRNVLERLKLLTNDDREDLLLMLSGDAVQRLKARLCCTVEEENAHEEALCAAAAAQAAYQLPSANLQTDLRLTLTKYLKNMTALTERSLLFQNRRKEWL